MSSMISQVIVDIFREIVQEVSSTQHIREKIFALHPASNGNITYLHGHPVELVHSLNSMQGDLNCGFIKYPAILLFQDFEERLKNRIYTADLHVIIVNSTKPTLKANERYEKNFKPLLYPIYEQFIKVVKRRNATYDIDIRKIDRLFWGQKGLTYYDEGGTQNVFNDYLDAIEIFINFKITEKKCAEYITPVANCNAQI